MARTPEQGHTLECLSATMIAAHQNKRDSLADWVRRSGNTTEARSAADFEYRLFCQDNTAIVWADEWLRDGTATCICPD